MKTLQNFSAGPAGGGGVEYAVMRCSINTGGCAMTCVSVGDNAVCVRRDRREQDRRWSTRTEGCGREEIKVKIVFMNLNVCESDEMSDASVSTESITTLSEPGGAALMALRISCRESVHVSYPGIRSV